MAKPTGRIASATVAVGIVLSAAACSSAPIGAPQSSAAQATAGSASMSADSRPTSSATANNSVVQWGDGRSAPGMKQGVPNPPGWYQAAFGPRTTEKILYLTYDDGPWPPYTDQILGLLAANGAKATFFVTGQQAQAHPDYPPRIIAGGNAIGDHTMTHADLVALPKSEVRRELTQVQRIVGSDLGKCMRPPYGLIDNKVAAVSQELGLTPILWTGHAQDWSPPSLPRMVELLKAATQPGAVILLHDSAGKERTVEATKIMLPWWREQGYKLETVPACRVG